MSSGSFSDFSKLTDIFFQDTEIIKQFLVEQLPFKIMILDLDGRIIFSNCHNICYELLIGDSIYKYIPVEHQEKLRRFMDNVLHTGNPENIELPIFLPNGLTPWWSIYFKPAVKDGDAIGFLMFITDITKYRLLEEELRQSEEKLRGIFDSSPDAITVTDLNLNIVDCNQAALDLHGFADKKEMLGKNALDFLIPEDRQRAINKSDDTLKKGFVKNVEYTYISKDGNTFPVELSASVVHDSSGNPMFYVGISKDITERKKSMELEKMAALGRMTASIAHEINNPLGGIKNAFRLIRNAIPEDYPYYEYVGMIENEINRIAHFTHQILGLYQPDQDIPHTFSINKVISDVVNLLELAFRDREVNVEVNIDSNIIVYLQKSLLQQVLYDIIKNAIEASSQNMKVYINAMKVNNSLFLDIFDQGCGIPKEIQHKIFQPFFTTKNNQPGRIGLGLYVSNNIINLLGGTIDFESETGKGTAFHIKLPLNNLGSLVNNGEISNQNPPSPL